MIKPGHDPQDAGLAGAVRADNADLRAGQEGQRDVVENDLVAVGLADLAHGEDVLGHTSSLRLRAQPDALAPAAGAGRHTAQAADADAGSRSSALNGSTELPATDSPLPGVDAGRPAAAQPRGPLYRSPCGRCGPAAPYHG